ncbi:hypothetical protein TNCT_279701 [Trichonephila clavata]|uniref:Uncharacterized protein n=1 Tax=Trichonephila clavata TaxID=2740835 RepID=A0A8X6HCT9_TRICU|nr:hypothetical protein TNCT_279701 [Trichonephila clavata]
MELNPEIDKDMDSETLSRPTTPQASARCMRFQELSNTLHKLSIFVQGAEFTLSSLQRFGNFNENDHLVRQTLDSLQEYTSLQAQAEGEFASLPPCDTIGCPYHVTPINSPSKYSITTEMELEPDRLNLNKRKDNDDGFISPPSRKKQTKLNSPPSKLNFEIQLSNKFEKLGKETAGTLKPLMTPPQPVFSTSSKATSVEKEEVRFSILRKIRLSPDVSVTSPALSSLSAGVLTPPPTVSGILSPLAERMDEQQDDNGAYAELRPNFHRGFNINTLADSLNECRFSDETALYLAKLEEVNVKLREFPYEKEDEQRFALQHISDLIDEARHKYTQLRKQEIADLTNTLEQQIDSWGLPRKPLENPFQIVLHKKKRGRNSWTKKIPPKCMPNVKKKTTTSLTATINLEHSLSTTNKPTWMFQAHHNNRRDQAQSESKPTQKDTPLPSQLIMSRTRLLS